MDTDTNLWGNRLVRVCLPTFDIHFTGLSNSQKQRLETEYNFVSQDMMSTGRMDDRGFLSCSTYRLKEPVSISSEAVTRDNLYSPLLKRSDHLIEITGINFRASFELGNHPKASLGTFSEQELCDINVFENFMRIYSAYRAVMEGGTIFHSAGFVVDNKSLVFVGRSGVGKSTLTKCAYEYGATILSDDVNLLVPNQGRFSACKVPFSGEFGRTLPLIKCDDSYPVRALILLTQGPKTIANHVSRSIATSRLLAGCPFVNADDDMIDRVMDVLDNMIDQLPVIELAVRFGEPLDAILTQVSNAIVAQ